MTLCGNFLEFSRVFDKKIPNPLNLKNFKTPPSKNFWLCPWKRASKTILK